MRRGFSLMELLIVVGIIAVLIGILVPTASAVRRAAQAANTQNEIGQISAAIERYYQDFGAYPGPISNSDTYSSTCTVGCVGSATGFDLTNWSVAKTTMSQNLVLALCGGLHYDPASATIWYDPILVGQGPQCVNPANPRRYEPYLGGVPLSWKLTANGKTGHYWDDAGAANDNCIPVFLDMFSDPMPILYLRCRVAVLPNVPAITLNGIDGAGAKVFGSYDLSQVTGYTTSSIGVGRKLPNHGLQTLSPNDLPSTAYPYDGTTYLLNQALSQLSSAPYTYVPKQKDAYILISAGKDRVYGTNDDITNAGSLP